MFVKDVLIATISTVKLIKFWRIDQNQKPILSFQQQHVRRKSLKCLWNFFKRKFKFLKILQLFVPKNFKTSAVTNRFISVLRNIAKSTTSECQTHFFSNFAFVVVVVVVVVMDALYLPDHLSNLYLELERNDNLQKNDCLLLWKGW